MATVPAFHPNQSSKPPKSIFNADGTADKSVETNIREPDSQTQRRHIQSAKQKIKSFPSLARHHRGPKSNCKKHSRIRNRGPKPFQVHGDSDRAAVRMSQRRNSNVQPPSIRVRLRRETTHVGLDPLCLRLILATTVRVPKTVGTVGGWMTVGGWVAVYWWVVLRTMRGGTGRWSTLPGHTVVIVV